MPLPLLAGIGLASGLISGIGSIFGRGKANREMDKLLAQNPKFNVEYQENPLAKQRLGLAQQLLNARAPGALAAERNIYTNQANQFANVNRGATDASQALAMAAGVSGQTNQAFNNLAQGEAQDFQRRQNNLVGAQEGMINEGDKVYQNQVMKYQDDVRRFQDMAQIRGAQNANRQNNWADIGNMSFGLANFGLSGGFGNMFGRGNQAQAGNTSYYNGNSQNSGYSDFQPWGG